MSIKGKQIIDSTITQHKLNLSEPVNPYDAATKQYVDDNLGNVISNAKGNKIEHVGTPTSDDAAATKKYVDDHVCTDAK